MTVRFTYNEVRALKPCQDGFREANKLLDNWRERGYTLFEMYKLGVDYEDILWLMAETPKISDRVKVLFSVGCAERVLHFYEEVYPADDTLRKALATARKYLDGLVTFSELESASRAAWAAAAASRAAWAADAAAAAAWAADAATADAADQSAARAVDAADTFKREEQLWQMEHLEELLEAA